MVHLSLVGSVDMVIEAVIEDIGLKQRIFADLESACPPHAILATNTSTIDIDLVGAKLKVRYFGFLSHGTLQTCVKSQSSVTLVEYDFAEIPRQKVLGVVPLVDPHSQ